MQSRQIGGFMTREMWGEDAGRLGMPETGDEEWPMPSACTTGSGGSGQNAALTAERVSACLWRISPLAVSDEVAMRAIWFVLATLLLLPPPAFAGGRHGHGGGGWVAPFVGGAIVGGLLDGAAAPYYAVKLKALRG